MSIILFHIVTIYVHLSYGFFKYINHEYDHNLSLESPDLPRSCCYPQGPSPPNLAAPAHLRRRGTAPPGETRGGTSNRTLQLDVANDYPMKNGDIPSGNFT